MARPKQEWNVARASPALIKQRDDEQGDPWVKERETGAAEKREEKP